MGLVAYQERRWENSVSAVSRSIRRNTSWRSVASFARYASNPSKTGGGTNGYSLPKTTCEFPTKLNNRRARGAKTVLFPPRCAGSMGAAGLYFHSQTLESVLPAASTSYSKAPHALFKAASFCEGVR